MGANEVITPGGTDPKGKAAEREEELGLEEATRYRDIGAKLKWTHFWFSRIFHEV